MLMTCPSADRLCSIPDSDGPRWPIESSSSELPPSRPGLKLGRLLSPTCANTQIIVHMSTKKIKNGIVGTLITPFLYIYLFIIQKNQILKQAKRLAFQFNFTHQLPGGAGQQVHSAQAAVPSCRFQLVFGVFITSGTGIHTSSGETYIGHLEVLLSEIWHILMCHSENCLHSLGTSYKTFKSITWSLNRIERMHLLIWSKEAMQFYYW